MNLSMSKGHKLKTLSLSLLKLLLAAGLITWLVSSGKVDFLALKELLEPKWIAIGLSIVCLNWFFAALRWKILLKTQGINLSYFEVMRLTMIGGFFNFVIPGGVGGDVVKGFYIARENPNERIKSIISIAIDRLLGLFSMVLMALFVLIYDIKFVLTRPELTIITISLSIVFILFMVFWVLIFSRRFVSKGWVERVLSRLPLSHSTTKIYRAFAEYKDAKNAFFKAILCSFISQFFSILFFIFAAHALNFTDISLHSFFFVVPIGFMITAIPISPAGVGVGQAAFYFLFNLVISSPSAVGAMTITALQIFNFIFGLFGAFFYITSKNKMKSQMVEDI
jgi:glycosyltransferase 2 family protein